MHGLAWLSPPHDLCGSVLCNVGCTDISVTSDAPRCHETTMHLVAIHLANRLQM